MANLETRKAEIRERIEEGLEIVQDLKDERGNLNVRRAEAEELDRAELSRLHREYVAETEAGRDPSRPISFHENLAGVEERAQKMPVDIEKAELEVKRDQLQLTTLERSEALAAEKAPRERLERIRGEVAQLQEEERQADNEYTNARRATEVKQQEETRFRQEVSQLEEGLAARTRVSPLQGVVMG